MTKPFAKTLLTDTSVHTGNVPHTMLPLCWKKFVVFRYPMGCLTTGEKSSPWHDLLPKDHGWKERLYGVAEWAQILKSERPGLKVQLQQLLCAVEYSSLSLLPDMYKWDENSYKHHGDYEADMRKCIKKPAWWDSPVTHLPGSIKGAPQVHMGVHLCQGSALLGLSHSIFIVNTESKTSQRGFSRLGPCFLNSQHLPWEPALNDVVGYQGSGETKRAWNHYRHANLD